MDEKTIGYATCNHCGERFPSETHKIFRHMRTKHPERWAQIIKEVEEEQAK